jgi:predicted RNA-binding protein with PUA-like domain
VPNVKKKSPGERFWLMKSEPEAYSIDDFKHDKKTLWTGVRNYQARNFMMTGMQPGDEFLFYHSNAKPSGIVGLGRIVRTHVPDPSAIDRTSDYYDPKASHDHPIWFCAEVEYVAHLKRPVSLDEIKKENALAEMLLLRKGQRLSIQPVTAAEFKTVLKIADRAYAT